MPLRSSIANAVLLLALGACTSLRRVQPAQFFATNSPDVVWVTYTNSAVVLVAEPEIPGDTLRGMRRGTLKPVAIPLGEVRSVQARTHDPMKTAIFVTGLGAALVGGVYFIWVVQAGPNQSGVNCGFFETARNGDPNGAPKPYC